MRRLVLGSVVEMANGRQRQWRETAILRELLLATTALCGVALAGPAHAATVNINSSGTTTIAVDPAATPAIDFQAGGASATASVVNNVNITGTVITANNGGGTLTLTGGTQTVSGMVGTAGFSVSTINAGNGVSTFGNDVFAQATYFNGSGSINFNGNVTGVVVFTGPNGTINLSAGKSINGNVDNSGAVAAGTLNLLGGVQTVTGFVGGGTALNNVNAGANGAVSIFNGNVFANNLNITGTGQIQLNGVGNNTPAVNFAGDGSLVLADGVNLTGAGGITTAGNSTGTLVLLGSSTIAGPVGTSGNPLGVITAQGNGSVVTFSSLVIANDLNITGSGTVNLNGVGVNTPFVTFTQDGQLVLGNGANLSGGVFTSNSNKGTLTLLGSSTLTGSAGTAVHPLNAINSGANNATDAFLGNVFATTLNLTGHGTTIFDANTTISSPTTINSGTLVVGDAASVGANYTGDITVKAGGMLAGHGTITGNVTNTGGIVAPGGTIGTLGIIGNYSQGSAGTLAIELNPSQSSRLVVSGTAALAGTLNAQFDPGSYIKRSYTILTAGGGLGGTTFDTLANTNLPAGFKTSLSYDANDVFVNLALIFSVPSGLNQNQQNVANALTNFFNSTGGIPAVYGTLTPAGLTQASGENATGIQQTTVDAMTQFMGVMTDPFIAGRCDAAAASNGSPAGACSDRNPRDAYGMIGKAPPAPLFDQRWSVWAAGYGGSQTTGGNAIVGSNTTTSSLGAVVAGADYRISPSTIAGFALAGGGTSFSVANGGGGRSDLFQAGAFVHHTFGPAYLTAALAYGWQDVTTDRTITIAGIDQLRARFNANAFSGRVESGYRFVTSWMGVTPYAAGQVVIFDLPSYAESVVSGANAFALAYGAKTVTASRSEVGLRTDRSFAIQDGVFTLRGRLAWAHDYDTSRSIAATFQALPGASFVVNGAAPAHDAALTTASAEMKWKNGWSTLATFEGEFSQVTRSYAGKGVVRYQW